MGLESCAIPGIQGRLGKEIEKICQLVDEGAQGRHRGRRDRLIESVAEVRDRRLCRR